MMIDSLYLLGVRLMDWMQAGGSDTLLSVWAFLLHVVLGLALVIPVLVYGIGHMRRARSSPNRNARRVGYVLFLAALVLLVSGLLPPSGVEAGFCPLLSRASPRSSIQAPF